ncbi:TPA: DUF2213 domain-containing protein [Citrobacter freundii]|uniref:DUF2213 domain-containing protein n=1 Tax=Citrobacter freundii TaxID=546 RepID=UPI001D20FB4C|nr:DUF2213 domain-containing protein [Citrobacter freundii]CAE6262846.1 hypothetical protein AI2642V1_3652 [Citrobacter freundii]CAH3643029.1 hypothetical protein AI2642V1_3652 [Citrobacter freundii]
MPVHQKDGKWYWGSKGPFVSKEKAEEVERAAYANGYRGDSYDMGSSVRAYDDYGRMNITQCNISKECVSPYRGSSLPGWRDLGLNPDRLYYIYRPAEELIRAADSFNNVPVTIEHPNQLDTPDTPQERVGTTGTDTRFESPYLVTSMKLWDKDAIEGVENSTRRELSIFPSFFDLDMTPGEFMGQAYDGVARNISGNSVALTIKGRVGAECAVGDSQDQEETLMEGLTDLIKTKFATASDSDADELAKGIMELMAQHEQKEINSGDEDEEKDLKDKEERERAEREKLKKEGKDKEDNKMGDSAIRDLVSKAKNEALAEARREFAATREAMRTVEPVYGHVSGDSADDIYKAVLKQEKVNIDGVHPSAYKALVQMAIHGKTSKQPVGDSAEKQASAADFKDYF